MKVKDLIGKLIILNPELDVCLGDWTYNGYFPSKEEVEHIHHVKGMCENPGGEDWDEEKEEWIHPVQEFILIGRSSPYFECNKFAYSGLDD
jgi:hypothetical protein|tara:strand:- start:8100 stop:8372 length:273 start_codon:yes stop_codon:yes gene_type:complete